MRGEASRASAVAEPTAPATRLIERSSPQSLPPRKHPRARRRAWKAGLDVGGLMVAGLTVAGSGASAGWAAVAALCCLSLLAMAGQYQILAPSLAEDLRTAAAVAGVASMVAATLSAAVGGSLAATDLVVVWLAMMSALTATRALLTGLDARRWLNGRGTRRTLIIGAGQVSRQTARRLAERPGLGLSPIGFLDLNPLEGDDQDPRVLGASWDLDRVVAEHQIDSVLVGFSSAPHHVLLRTVNRCWELGLEVMVVPRLFELQGLRSRTRHVGGLPLVSLERSSYAGPSLRVAEAFDRLAALLIMTLLAPLLAGTALAVKLTSDGPVLYRAARIGKDGRPFEMLKFRTMLGHPDHRGELNADWAAETLRRAEGAGETLALLTPAAAGGDLHTPIGKLLRRTTLDELPQLWNVVRGEMALVGPRPELACFVPLFSTAIHRYDARHRVRPGMTGWAQVQGLRGKTSLAERVEWDNFYIENRSIFFDLKIMVLTVVAIWRS